MDTRISTNRFTIILIVLILLSFTQTCLMFSVRYKKGVDFAGNGESTGMAMDGELATNAQVSLPESVISCNDNVYIVDGYGVIRKVDKNGYISRHAGRYGVFSDEGDGDALSVSFRGPKNLFCDNSTNTIYLSDEVVHKIKKVENGKIVTVVGTGGRGFSADGTLANQASLIQPKSPIIYKGELYFSDTYNNRIRKVNMEGKLITVLGTGVNQYSPDYTPLSTASIQAASSISFNSKGELIFAENYFIRKIDVNGNLITVAGNGNYFDSYKTNLPATLSHVYAFSLLIDPQNDDIIFSDLSFKVLRRIDQLGLLHTISGEGTDLDTDDANSVTLGSVYGLTFEESTRNILFTVWEDHKVLKLTPFCPTGFPYDPSNDTCLNTCNGFLSNTSSACSFSGECTKGGVCACGIGRSGDNCNVTTCNNIDANDENVCNQRGHCYGQNVCSCQEGYTGQFCEIPKCYGYLSTDTKSVCSGYGTCNDRDQCSCNQYYGGEMCQWAKCFGKLSNDSTACSGRGVCYAYMDYYSSCDCGSTGYAGNECEEIGCFGNGQSSPGVCNGFGKCVTFDVCNCSTGYQGENCDIYSCFGVDRNDPNVCSGRGYCSALDTCVCNDPFSGSYCQNYSCNGKVNTDPEVCTNIDTGECGKAGHCYCSAPDTCSCKTGYYGNGCLQYTCNSIEMNNDTVCSGRGNCTAYETCTCRDGYVGSNCESFYCFGIKSNDSNVCSGQGNCSTPNSCQCGKLFYGQTCQEFDCYGINKAVACSDNGICQSPEVCKCSEGYEGLNCSTKTVYTCNGVLSNSSDVCSGKGLCFENVCQCSENYGSDCSFELIVSNVSTIFNPKYNFTINTVLKSSGSAQSVVYNWMEIFSAVNLANIANSVTQPDLVIKAGNTNVLKEGLKLSLLLNVTISEHNGRITILSFIFNTSVNKNPVIEEITVVDNSTLIETTSGKGYQTTWMLKIRASDPDLDEITYSFGYTLGNSRTFLYRYGSESSIVFKLPFTSIGMVTCFLTVTDSNMGETTKYLNMTVVDPTENMVDLDVANFAIQLLSSKDLNIADISAAANYLSKFSNLSSQMEQVIGKIVKSMTIDIFTGDKDICLDILNLVTKNPQIVDLETQIDLMRLMNSNIYMAHQQEKVVKVASNLIYSNGTSMMSNLIRNFISNITIEQQSNYLNVGEMVSFASSNFNATLYKKTISSLSSTFGSGVGLGEIKIPSDSLNQILTKIGYDTSNPILISLSVFSKLIYSYNKWNMTSPILNFRILSSLDSKKTLHVSGLSSPIEFELPVDNILPGFIPQCVFVNELTNSLSGEGIETIRLSPGRVKCRASHLTDFTTIPISEPASNSPKPSISPISSKRVISEGSIAFFDINVLLMIFSLIILCH